MDSSDWEEGLSEAESIMHCTVVLATILKILTTDVKQSAAVHLVIVVAYDVMAKRKLMAGARS